MMPAHYRSMTGIVALLAALMSLLIVATPVGATGGGGGGGAYRADIGPASAAAGTESTLVVTLTQLSGSSDQRVRSARVSAPSGIQIMSATAKKDGNTLTVNVSGGAATVDSIPPLNSGQTATITLRVAIPCGVGGSRTWDVAAKNGTPFATGGSALDQDAASQLTTNVSRCSLAFAEQPASTGEGMVITSVPADPSGTRVKVRLLDGNGDTASQSGVTVSLAIVSGTGASGASLWVARPPTPRTATVSHRSSRPSTRAIAGTASRPARPHRPIGVVRIVDIDDKAQVCSGACSTPPAGAPRPRPSARAPMAGS